MSAIPQHDDLPVISDVLVFTLSNPRTEYGVPVSCVERVVPSVRPLAVLETPDVFHGVVNLEGFIMPVVNLHKVFGSAFTGVDLDDRIIVVLVGGRRIGLLVNGIQGVKAIDGDCDSLFAKSFTSSCEGIIRTGDGLILVYNLPMLLESLYGDILGSFFANRK